jgi:pyruvate/2-oxoglutarate dehydrogenase complex dihydrolipoamide acyltransferase (E2) component
LAGPFLSYVKSSGFFLKESFMLSKHAITISLLLSLDLLFAIGCGKRKEEQQSRPETRAAPQPAAPEAPAQPGVPTQEQLAVTAEQTQQALAQANHDKVIEAVDFRKLKELFPENLIGMKRTDASGERTKVSGVDVSNAEATYETPNDPSQQMTVMITDMGNVAGPFRMGLTAWAATEFDRETESGYEKTTTYKGYRAVEEFDRQNQQAKFRVFVADRFIVEVDGSNISMEMVKKAVDEIDLSRLASLAGAK